MGPTTRKEREEEVGKGGGAPKEDGRGTGMKSGFSFKNPAGKQNPEVIRNPNRKPPQFSHYEPEHVVLGVEPHAEVVRPEEVRDAILMNSQTLGAMSRRGPQPVKSLPVKPNSTTGLPNPTIQNVWMSRQGVAGEPHLMSVAKQSWEATGDVLSDDIQIPAFYAAKQPDGEGLSDENQGIEEVDSPEVLQNVPEGHYCIAVKDALISVETKEKAFKVIEFILDGDDEQFSEVVLSDIALFKRVPILFGFHCGE
jgi:hypothetical protein